MPNLDENKNDEQELEQQFDEEGNLIENEENQEQHLEDNEPQEFTEEELTRLLATSDEKLRAMGIDDPKNWKSYQKYAQKVQKEAKLNELKYQNMIAQNNAQFESLRAQMGQPKPTEQQEEKLVKPVPPQMPEKPKEFAWTDVALEGSPSQAYMDKLDEYNRKRDQYLQELSVYTDKHLTKITETTMEMQQRAVKQQQLEAMKTDAIGRFIKAGLTPAEAQQCWKEATENSANFYTPEAVAQMFKLSKGGKSSATNKNVQKFNDRRDKINKFGTVPGIGKGNIDYDSKEHYTKNSDHSDWYKTK
jgi:hypothetical protein